MTAYSIDTDIKAMQLLAKAESLMRASQDRISNMANLASMLYWSMEDVNWVGFYIRRGNTLYLGPFHGKSACTIIPIGKGVCGVAAAERHTVIVDDVSNFDNYISCDSATRSEVVVPVLLDGDLYAVLDVDGSRPARFGAAEKSFFEELVNIYINSITGNL